MGDSQSKIDSGQSAAWNVRVGQIQTVLSYFGTVCSVSVERPDGVTVYVQAERVEVGLELEAVGDTYLPLAARLTDRQVREMRQLGWVAPNIPDSPNFTRTVGEGADLHEVAVGLARTLRQVYGVRDDDTWMVSPPEFAQVGAGLGPDPAEAASETDQPVQRLRESSGVALAAAVASEAVTFEDCLAAGLPRGDRFAELAMLYRPDCPVAFLRKSAFHLSVLGDPNLPSSTARALLASRPAAYEIARLAKRGDMPREALLRASMRGHRLARSRGESGGEYLRLDCVPRQRLTELADQQDGEAVGMLRNPRCDDELILRYLFARSARVRYTALATIKRRNLPIDSSLIRIARDLPATDYQPYSYADRVKAIADQILAAR